MKGAGMKKISLAVILCLSTLAVAVQVHAQTNLLVERRVDSTLWAMRCDGVGPTACDAWTRITGKFASQPSLTWDSSLGLYLATGVSDGKVWKGTFNGDGTFNNNWTEVRGATAASSAIAAKVPSSSRVVIVDASGGGNFTSPRAALASITTATATDRYLVKIMPGVYDIEATPLQMKEYVDIEGSGELVTTIIGAVDGTGFAEGVVQGANNAQLRSLTVENTFAAGTINLAIANFDTSPTLLHVRAIAGGGGADTQNVGVFNSGGAPRLSHVTVTTVGGLYTYGVYNDLGASTIMEDVTIEASGAVHNTGVRNANGSEPQLKGVTILVSAVGVTNPGSDCTGIYNNASSPRIQDVAVTATGGQRSLASNVGMINVDSSPTLVNMSLSATGGGDDIGIQNKSASSPSLTNVLTYGGTTGIQNLPAGNLVTITIDRSTVTGGTNAIDNDDGATLFIGASKLGGALNTLLGAWTCTGCYTDAFTALGAGCN